MTGLALKRLDEWRADAQFFNAGPWRIAYWTAADEDETKPWLLLIHGYPTSAWDWTAVWPELSQRFRCAAIDMLGYGLSSKPTAHRYSIMEQASLQESFLEFLGVGEAHILAHDYGDTVAQELLARQGENALSFSVRSIMFLNGGLFPEQHRPRPLQRLGLTPLGFLIGKAMTRKKLRAALDEVFGPDTKASAEEIKGYWALMRESDGLKVLHKLLQYIPERKKYRARWVGALSDTHIPLRPVDGGRDPVSGKHLYDYYRENILNADAVLLPEIGHYPQTEAPQAVVDAFFDFHRRIGTISR